MKRFNLNKKQLNIIITAILIVLLCVLGFNIFWGLFVMLPILIFADICYILFPLSLLTMIVLSIISSVKHDYTMFKDYYKLLAVMVSVGFIDMFFEKSVSDNYFSSNLFLVWNILLMIYLLFSVIFISRKNDTRLYTFVFLPIVLLCLFRDFINVVG